MAKPPATIYICSHCDSQYPKWSGRCAECGQWGTLLAQSGAAATAAKRLANAPSSPTVRLHEIDHAAAPMLDSDWPEVNRVLGGGFVPGSLTLLGGDPGIGKSTLILQLAAKLAARGRRVMYASGEESAAQVGRRWQRVGEKTAPLEFLAETRVESLVSTMESVHPDLMIIDSIQTMTSAAVPSEAGSVQQVRAVTVQLMAAAKQSQVAMILIGHVTKDGAMAGPKALEHLVDVVLYLEGDPLSPYRLLRAVKNRYGTTNEVGVFDMGEQGLVDVPNPSAAFLGQRQAAPGAVATVILEGIRPFAVEVQALVNKSPFGLPRRTATGFDVNRLHVLAAVLAKHGGLKLGDADIFVNVVGGLKINERGADAAVAMAMATSLQNRPVDPQIAVIGEIGLGGEVRSVNHLDRRLQEAAHLGFTRAVIPPGTKTRSPKGLVLVTVANVSELLQAVNAKAAT